MNILFVMFWVLVVLNITDLGFTTYILHHGGEEANPYVNYLIQQFGVISGILLAKVPPFVLLGYILYNHEDKISSPIMPYIFGSIIMIYLWVNVYSYILMRSL
jgi:hypothetical protein